MNTPAAINGNVKYSTKVKRNEQKFCKNAIFTIADISIQVGIDFPKDTRLNRKTVGNLLCNFENNIET